MSEALVATVPGGDESWREASAELANLSPFRDGQLGADKGRLSPVDELQLDLRADERSRPLSG